MSDELFRKFMSQPDYLAELDHVAAIGWQPASAPLEDRLSALWSEYEKLCAELSPVAHDVLMANPPAELRRQTRQLIETLRENGDKSPSGDAEQIRSKNAQYGGSWASRGGVGAFHAMARKPDRFLSQIRKHGSIQGCREALEELVRVGDSIDSATAALIRAANEGIDDTIGDWRRYLVLFESWHVAADRRAEPAVFTLSDVGDAVIKSVNPTATKFVTTGASAGFGGIHMTSGIGGGSASAFAYRAPETISESDAARATANLAAFMTNPATDASDQDVVASLSKINHAVDPSTFAPGAVCICGHRAGVHDALSCLNKECDCTVFRLEIHRALPSVTASGVPTCSLCSRTLAEHADRANTGACAEFR